MAALRLLLVAALLALPLWVAQPAPAHACTPPIPTLLQDDVRSADIIVFGTLGEMLVLPPESVAHPEMLSAGFMPVEAKFVVSEYLKGPGPVTPLIYQAAEEISYDAGAISSILVSTPCGPAINVGTRYVMFLAKFDSLRYNSANGTRQFVSDQDFADYIVRVREAVAAERIGLPPTGSGPAPRSAPGVPLVAASALAGLGLAANAAFAIRRRSS